MVKTVKTQCIASQHRKEEKKIPNLRFPGFEGEWNIKKLGKYCKFQQGVQVDVELQKREPYQGYVRFLRIENYTQNSNDFRYISVALAGNKSISKDEIAVVRYGATAGYIGRGFEGVLANNLFEVIPDQQILANNFLFEYLNSHKAFRFFQSEMIGGAMPALSFSIVKVLKVPITSLPEQKKIASFLSAVDQKIQQLTRKKEVLELYKKGVMQKIFSQEIRFRDKNGNDYPDWEEKRLGEVGEIVGGGTPETSNPKLWNGGIQWYTPTEIATKYISRSNRTISNLGLHSSSAKLLPVGTLLFTSRATIAEVSFALEECSTNQGFQSIIVNKNNCSEFVYYLFTQNKKEFIRRSQGSTFLEISKNEMRKIKMQLPCFGEQKGIGQFMKVIDEKIESIKTQITQTRKFKKGLLQQMFV